MNDGSTLMDGLPTVITRSQVEAEATAAHRARYLSKLTPKIIWFAIPVIAGLMNITLLLIKDPTLADYAIAFGGLCLCAFSAISFYRDDLHYRALAELTPVYDLEALQAQIRVLTSSTKLLGEACKFRDPEMIRQAIAVAFGALAPLLARGPTTVQNARTEGYPLYPDVAIWSCHDDTGEAPSPHIIMIEASAAKLGELSHDPPDKIVFAETVSHLAGQLVPPLRAIQLNLPVKTITAKP